MTSPINSRLKLNHGTLLEMQKTPTENEKERGSYHVLPLSLSDLFSCSVSVRVSTELERLDRQELLPDDLPSPPRPHSRMARSGDITAWLSLSRSWAVPTAKPRWGRPTSEQKARPRRGGGSQIPSWRRLKCWPETQTDCKRTVFEYVIKLLNWLCNSIYYYL